MKTRALTLTITMLLTAAVIQPVYAQDTKTMEEKSAGKDCLFFNWLCKEKTPEKPTMEKMAPEQAKPGIMMQQKPMEETKPAEPSLQEEPMQDDSGNGKPIDTMQP